MKYFRGFLIALLVSILVMGIVIVAVAENQNLPLGVRRTAILRFAVIGDPHYGWTDVQNFYASDIVDAWMTDKTFPDIDFAINVGDFVSGDYADTMGEVLQMWETAMDDSFNRMLLPWVFAFGNHDVQEDSEWVKSNERAKIAKRETGTMQRYFGFLWNNILFLVHGWKEDEQEGLSNDVRVWLEFMADSYPDATTVVISHGGPECGSEWWMTFIDNNPQIVLFIHGHHHNFRHYEFHGVDAIDCGHTNDSKHWTGFPWTHYFEITEDGIQGNFYDVLEQKWVPIFEKFNKSMHTGIKDIGLEWYSVSKFVHDGQLFTQYNRIIAKNYNLQLIGSGLELTEQNKTVNTESETRDFSVMINGEDYFYAGSLSKRESCLFDLNHALIRNELWFEVRVDGCKTGFIRMIYEKPILWSDDISVGVNAVEDNIYDCHFEMVSRYTSGKISLCPLNNSVVDIEAAESLRVKDYYTAYVMDKSKIPGDYKVYTALPISPKIILEDLVVPETVKAYDLFEISAIVRNEGGRCTIKIGLYVDSKLSDSKTVLMKSGESKRLVFTPKLYKPGEYDITIASLEPKTVKVTTGAPF